MDRRLTAGLGGEGVALEPAKLFRRELDNGQLVAPFRIEADVGSYWLTHLKSRNRTPAMIGLRTWLQISMEELR
jgi:LysR family transcriptional regulator of beta-lactamase